MALPKATRDKGAVNGARRAAPGFEGLLAAASQCFYAVGYGGTSVREIASRADVTVAALYHHFESKHAILKTLMLRAMQTALSEAESAHAAAGPDPVDQFDAIVQAHVKYHTAHQVEAFVGNSELRSLEPRDLREILALRDEHERLFLNTILAGIEAGVFHVDYPQQAARAVLAMCTAVATWYRRSGPLTVNDVVEQYTALARNLVGYSGPHVPPAAKSRPRGVGR